MKIVYRKQVEEDYAFIYATYLRNRWFDKKNTTTLKRATWSGLQHNRLENILKNDYVVIACFDDDTNHVVGYAFHDDGNVFSYVKLAFRGDGLKIKEHLIQELYAKSENS